MAGPPHAPRGRERPARGAGTLPAAAPASLGRRFRRAAFLIAHEPFISRAGLGIFGTATGTGTARLRPPFAAVWAAGAGPETAGKSAGTLGGNTIGAQTTPPLAETTAESSLSRLIEPKIGRALKSRGYQVTNNDAANCFTERSTLSLEDSVRPREYDCGFPGAIPPTF